MITQEQIDQAFEAGTPTRIVDELLAERDQALERLKAESLLRERYENALKSILSAKNPHPMETAKEALKPAAHENTGGEKP
jgi:hypothetical protein